jgi:AraC-like DNA-binding protein
MQAPPLHQCLVIGSPWAGVYCTHVASGRHYGKHWHSTYGLGLVEDGAQSSASGRGNVDAYAGDLIETCGLLLDRHANTGAAREAGGGMAQVRDRLADEALAVHPLGELARMARLSKYQLLRCFQKVYGVTPHAWLLQQRAERARKLIQGGAALAAAAASCGFADQSHMTRIFTRQFGFTPGAWQKAAAPRPQ